MIEKLDNEELEELYQSIVLQHSKKPLNFGDLENIEPIKGKNPSCGDSINLYVRLGQHQVEELKFTGEGCALCIASTSIMTKLLKGKSLDTSQAVIKEFAEILHGNKQEVENKEFELLETFKNVSNFPLRVKCAMLGWRALDSSISNHLKG